METTEMETAKWKGTKEKPIPVEASEILKAFAEGKNIYVEHAVINGNLDIGTIEDRLDRDENDKPIIRGNISIWFSEILGNVMFGGAKIHGGVSFNGAKINGDAGFSEAEISGSVGLGRAEIGGDVRFYKATIVGSVAFSDANIFREVFFDEAEICGDALFELTEIGGSAMFGGTKIGGSAAFGGIKIGGNAVFDESEIGRDVLFGKFQAPPLPVKKAGVREPEETKIDGSVLFRKAKIGGAASFDGVEIRGELIFRKAKFKEPAAQEEACRKAKRVLEDLGNRREADYHFYREMEAKRKQKHPVIRFLELPVQYLFGYGVNPLRVIGTWILTVLCFAFLFKNGDAVEKASSLWEYIYFSIVTAATPGHGGYHPKPGVYQILAGFEAIFGTFMWATFIVTFARKYMR